MLRLICLVGGVGAVVPPYPAAIENPLRGDNKEFLVYGQFNEEDPIVYDALMRRTREEDVRVALKCSQSADLINREYQNLSDLHRLRSRVPLKVSEVFRDDRTGLTCLAKEHLDISLGRLVDLEGPLSLFEISALGISMVIITRDLHDHGLESRGPTGARTWLLRKYQEDVFVGERGLVLGGMHEVQNQDI